MIKVENINKQFVVSKSFGKNKQTLYALNGIDLEIKKEEVCCVVGESGCGKTTLGRIIIGLVSPTSGKVSLKEQNTWVRLDNLSAKERLPYRKKMQMIFQNPQTSLNARMKIKTMLSEPLQFYQPNLNQQQIKEKCQEVLSSVGGDPHWLGRYPHEFSGGQKQRLSIARALMSEPDFLVADEPVSALDVSVQAQVLNLLLEMRKKKQLTYLFISHDMAVVEHLGTKVVVMYMGTICEVASKKQIFSNPKHPYTQLLLSAIPQIGKKMLDKKTASSHPNPFQIPQGCPFAHRCPFAFERCFHEKPLLQKYGNSHVSCHAVEENKIK